MKKAFIVVIYLGLIQICHSQVNTKINFGSEEYELVEKGSVKVIDGIIFKKVNDKFYKRKYDGIIYVKWYKEQFKGDGRKMLQEAINVASVNDVLIVEGEIKCDGPIKIDKTITIAGNSYVNSNDTHAGNNSRIYFNKSMDVCIDSKDINFKNITIAGNDLSTKIGIKAFGFVTLENVTVQMFDIGLYITEGYYNKFSNSVITYCRTNLVLNKCYNSNAYGVGFNTIPSGSEERTNIILLNSSTLNLFGCSIESFNKFGVSIEGGSRLNSYSTYFEGKQDIGRFPVCVNLEDKGMVNFLGNHVYLTEGTSTSFVNVGKNVREFSLISKNNFFEDSRVNSSNVVVYKFDTPSDNINIEISGDSFRNRSYKKYTSINNIKNSKISIRE